MWREYLNIKSLNATQILLNDKILNQFCSTSYLSLNWNSDFRNILNSYLSSLNPNVLSSFGSNYLGGMHPSRIIFEESISQECGFETSIAFSSGWNANYALAQYLGETHDLILSDKKSHNSIITGLKPYRQKVKVINVENLKDKDILLNSNSRIALIFPSIEGITGEHTQIFLSDSVLERLTVVVDESHSFGMFGLKGLSPIQTTKYDIRLLGFSKAFGHVGALACVSREIKSWIEQNAAVWIFSTPLPPYIWEINKLIFDFIQTLNEERRSIFANSNYFRELLKSQDALFTGDFHITGLEIPINVNVKEFEKKLIDNNIFLKVSGFPSAPKGKLIARITLNQHHTKQDIDYLSEALKKAFY